MEYGSLSSCALRHSVSLFWSLQCQRVVKMDRDAVRILQNILRCATFNSTSKPWSSTYSVHTCTLFLLFVLHVLITNISMFLCSSLLFLEPLPKGSSQFDQDRSWTCFVSTSLFSSGGTCCSANTSIFDICCICMSSTCRCVDHLSSPKLLCDCR